VALVASVALQKLWRSALQLADPQKIMTKWQHFCSWYGLCYYLCQTENKQKTK
jgi:hypothetical protein